MNKKPRPRQPQCLGIYSDHPDGGCMDLGQIQLAPGVGIYHEAQIEDMRYSEREQFIPYLLSVLSMLGHQK